MSIIHCYDIANPFPISESTCSDTIAFELESHFVMPDPFLSRGWLPRTNSRTLDPPSLATQKTY